MAGLIYDYGSLVSIDFEELQLFPGAIALANGTATYEYDETGHELHSIDLNADKLRARPVHIPETDPLHAMIAAALLAPRYQDRVLDLIRADLAERRDEARPQRRAAA